MKLMTPEEAEQFFCVFSLAGRNCVSTKCLMWRWQKPLADDPRFVEAIKAETARLSEETGKPGVVTHKQAVKNVMACPSDHGLPDAPEVGWCGLGGRPE